MARTNMAELIFLFRTFRADITSSVITDGQAQNLFDINRQRVDRISLSPDVSNVVYTAPFKFIESAPTLINSSDTVLVTNATDSNNINGIYVFNEEQDETVRLKGWRHNLFYTLALAYNIIAQSDDAWDRYKRGNVEFERREFGEMAKEFERMGFETKTTTLLRS